MRGDAPPNDRFSPGNCGIPLLQLVHPQAEQVVVEPAERLQALVERGLAGVSERRVPDVVRQRDRLREVFVEPQPAGDGAGESA
jgi:hypothetical protein